MSQEIAETDLFRTTWHNAREDGVPLQYALGLRTVNIDEAKTTVKRIKEAEQVMKNCEQMIRCANPGDGRLLAIMKCVLGGPMQ